MEQNAERCRRRRRWRGGCSRGAARSTPRSRRQSRSGGGGGTSASSSDGFDTAPRPSPRLRGAPREHLDLVAHEEDVVDRAGAAVARLVRVVGGVRARRGRHVVVVVVAEDELREQLRLHEEERGAVHLRREADHVALHRLEAAAAAPRRRAEVAKQTLSGRRPSRLEDGGAKEKRGVARRRSACCDERGRSRLLVGSFELRGVAVTMNICRRVESLESRARRVRVRRRRRRSRAPRTRGGTCCAPRRTTASRTSSPSSTIVGSLQSEDGRSTAPCCSNRPTCVLARQRPYGTPSFRTPNGAERVVLRGVARGERRPVRPGTARSTSHGGARPWESPWSSWRRRGRGQWATSTRRRRSRRAARSRWPRPGVAWSSADGTAAPVLRRAARRRSNLWRRPRRFGGRRTFTAVNRRAPRRTRRRTTAFRPRRRTTAHKA